MVLVLYRLSSSFCMGGAGCKMEDPYWVDHCSAVCAQEMTTSVSSKDKKKNKSKVYSIGSTVGSLTVSSINFTGF